jgi:hypothetical protein
MPYAASRALPSLCRLLLLLEHNNGEWSMFFRKDG